MAKKYSKVIWHDISGLTSGNNSCAWLSEEESIKEAQKLWELEYITIGEIIYENDNFIVIAATTDNMGLYSDSSMIPKCVIIRIEEFYTSQGE